MSDALADFRKVAAVPQALAEDVEPVEYVAFETKDDMFRLVIECGEDQEHAPLYQYLLDIGSDGKHGTRVVLVYTFMMVYIRGKNLYSMVRAIRGSNAAVIRKYVDRWNKPKDTSAPFIEEIEFTTQELGKSLKEEQKRRKPEIGVVCIRNTGNFSSSTFYRNLPRYRLEAFTRKFPARKNFSDHVP